ncbi:hypothetical protein BE221DRAFT_70349, partial [Ostreococcus tauri]
SAAKAAWYAAWYVAFINGLTARLSALTRGANADVGVDAGVGGTALANTEGVPGSLASKPGRPSSASRRPRASSRELVDGDAFAPFAPSRRAAASAPVAPPDRSSPAAPASSSVVFASADVAPPPPVSSGALRITTCKTYSSTPSSSIVVPAPDAPALRPPSTPYRATPRVVFAIVSQTVSSSPNTRPP